MTRRMATACLVLVFIIGIGSSSAQTQQVEASDKKTATDVEWWLVWVGIGQTAALILTILAIMRQTGTLKDSAQRQLRAYVMGESGTIVNIANPIPAFLGQVFSDTGAAITNLACGPIAYVQIKNTGQTPAFEVEHWGNICVREFPLTATLPSEINGTRTNLIRSVLGAGIPSTKTLFHGPLLTEQQIANLRAGTAAIYVYGEIRYTDIYKKTHFTKYRLMHHVLGGAIGVSTDLSFTEGGNEAD
jgi:hypothetical protein